VLVILKIPECLMRIIQIMQISLKENYTLYLSFFLRLQ
jgi:hypothetical protein